MLPKVLKNFNLFIDGRGYAGRVDEISLPKLTIHTEDYQLGGLDTALAMDMGKVLIQASIGVSGEEWGGGEPVPIWQLITTSFSAHTSQSLSQCSL